MSKAKKPPVKLSTQEIKERLEARYADRGWAILWEVANGTGARARRRADSLIWSVWPSRGIYCMGVEIKASRTDWLKELKNPEKADGLYHFCDYWYVVAGAKDIVRAGELPKTWGLMVPHASGLKIEKEAPELKPKKWTMVLLASILRNMAESHISWEQHNRSLEDAKKDAFEEGASGGSWELKRLRGLRDSVKEFEEASGLKISGGWPGPKVLGELVQRIGEGEPKQTLQKLAASLESVLRKVEEALVALVGETAKTAKGSRTQRRVKAKGN